MLDHAHHDAGLGQPFTAARRVVPWLLLGLVLIQVVGVYSTYQVNQQQWKAEQRKPKPSEVAAAAAAAARTPAADKKEEPRKEAAAPIAATSKVLILSDVTLRQDPSRGAPALRDLATGERLELVGKVDGWYKVKDGSDRLGWVSSSEKYTKVVDK